MAFVNPQYLVETGWLADHLDDPDLRVLDCTMYLPGYFEKVELTTISGREHYEQGHVPGAAYVDLIEELTDAGGIGASQTAHLLTLLGVENVALYDGSLAEWGPDPELPLVTGSAP